MQPDPWDLYRQMLRSRAFEGAVQRLWENGLISGEMHLGMGEEAVVAGIVDQMQPGDALALDHRATPPLVMRGVDLVSLLRELLGRPDGLCAGRGGHMHLFSPEHLAASSGIVGASGPAGAGFALAAQYLRPGTVAVTFFGEGAVNEGMLMEALNLAVVWELPVLFVCKDDEWAIATESSTVTGGGLVERAKSFGMPAEDVDGSDVIEVWHAANGALARARNGHGPTFLHASCVHLKGHFLGDPLFRISREPLKEMREVAGPLLRSLADREGAPLRERLSNLKAVTAIGQTVKERLSTLPDPLKRARDELKADEELLQVLEDEVKQEIQQAIAAAMGPA